MYDPMQGQSGSSRQFTTESGRRSTHNPSWELGLATTWRKFEHDYQEFDPRNAREAHLVYADGDLPKNKFAKFYHYLLNLSIVTRWFLFIVPILGILWIPGILGLTTFPHAHIWGVKLIWWSIWLSVVWGAWWASLAASYLLHVVAKSTIAVVAVDTGHYVDWVPALRRHIALFGWSMAVWISWTPLVADRLEGNPGNRSVGAIGLGGRVFFALFACAAILLFEKVAIQWIAEKFHERSYADRIAKQKFAVDTFVTLYQYSSDIPGRSDTLNNSSVDAKRFLKKFRHGVRSAATATTTALGNVASEIAGSSILQPNSPQAVVKVALLSPNKSRLLARRLFYSFRQPGAQYLYLKDIQRFFPTPKDAVHAFALLDRDGNGDASRDEMEIACVEVHREQLSLEHSMQDLDSAVGKLDNILMSVYSVVAAVIVAIALEAQLTTVVTGTGTLVLGLSWLIGESMQEILASVVFLFIKHPYDVGDRVQINKEFYTVQEINLLSTIFVDSSSAYVQAPNNILNTLWIQNIRRSKEMSEPFAFDVEYTTSFQELELLRAKMLDFLETEKRDFNAIFDLTIKDIPDQEMMTLTVNIMYRSNWQQDALRVKRRNKWLCALKKALGDVKIYGPKGDPDAVPAPTRYTQVPWELVDEKTGKDKRRDEPSAPQDGWQLSEKNAAILDSADEVFGEAAELHMPLRQGSSEEQQYD
ncbi:hypothetical protein APHAL10511_004925 [Amanita phalloides]|nr:hypothetical protein APHAL10511_004925 [Amanita phalloides]